MTKILNMRSFAGPQKNKLYTSKESFGKVISDSFWCIEDLRGSKIRVHGEPDTMSYLQTQTLI